MHTNPISRSRVRRMAWSLVRHPMKSRDFPAKHERLVTADELLHLEGVAHRAGAGHPTALITKQPQGIRRGIAARWGM